MKYIKGTQTESIKSYPLGKISLFDGKGFSESPWIGRIPDSNDAVLLNHALAFLPHESWGAIVPAGSFNFMEMLNKQELILHPEAWDSYVEQKIIDSEGNYIKNKFGNHI